MAKPKQYVLIYVDPENPGDLDNGDTEVIGIGTLEQCAEMATGERCEIDNVEDNRIPHLFIFDLSDGKKVDFIFPKPKIKVL